MYRTLAAPAYRSAPYAGDERRAGWRELPPVVFDPDLFRACWSTHQGFLGLFISRLGLFRSSNFIHRRKGCHNLRRTSQCLESQQTQNPSHDQFTLHREEGARRTRVRWFSTHCFDSSTDAFILPLFC